MQIHIAHEYYGDMFQKILIDKLFDFTCCVGVWIKYCDSDKIMAIVCMSSNLMLLNQLVTILWVSDLFYYCLIVTKEELKFVFHLEDFVLEKTADFFTFRVKYSQDVFIDLQFVMILSFDLFQSNVVEFNENVQELKAVEMKLSYVIFLTFLNIMAFAKLFFN